MSIASMTEVAFLRRKDVGSPAFVPNKLSLVAGASNGSEQPASSTNTALKTIVNYVPTEILTLYIAVLVAISPSGSAAAKAAAPPVNHWLPFWLFLIATPLVIWIVYATKVKTEKGHVPIAPAEWPVWEIVAGTIAYVAWALALPNSPISWPYPGIPGLIVLLTSTALGLLGPLFSGPILTRSA